MATTPNYSFSVYSSTDTDVRFLDFRVATAGSQSTSNFYVIDTVLKQHSDAIDSINATPSAFVVKGTYSSGSLYTASVANYPGYKNEQLIVLSLNQKNTGAVQININGTTNKDVMKYGSDGVLKAVEAGDFVANSPVLCLYDGTRFVVIGITSASSITVTGEAGDILQIADDGTIESSGKKAAQPNGIATLDENGNVVQVANMANSAAAVYDGEPVSVEYVGQNRIASITAYGETPQGGTTEAPVALTGVDSAILFEQHTPINLAKPIPGDFYGVSVITNADGSVTVKGTATNETWPRLVRVDIPSAIIAGYITISLSSPASVRVSFEAIKPDGRKESYTLSAGSTSMTVKIKSGYTRLHCFLSLLPDQTIDETFHIMIAQGTEPVPFVPYVEPSITHLPIPRPLRRVGDVKDKCVTRQEHEGVEKLVVTYNVGFVELDGTEAWQASSQTSGMFFITRDNISAAAAICSNFNFSKSATTEQGKFYIVSNQIRFLTSYETLESWKNYLAAQKAAGTPVQIAYQLAAPEVYATDPVDFDNAAGPLTVVTGGQVEVKMTDFVTDRTPAFLNKLDKTGDGSDVTVTFTEATEDADIASSDKLSILFGKILKRFSTITSKFTTVEEDISDIVDGTTTVANATTAATADKVKNKLSLLSGGGQDTIIYDGSTAIAAAMNSSFIGAEPAFIKNSAFNKNFGSSAGTVCQGNDGRLSNARRSSNISMSLSGTNLSISYS